MRELSRTLSGLLSGRGGLMATTQTLASSVLILAINLGTGILTARLLGPAGRGELAAVVMWPQFMAFMLTLGLPSSLLYNVRCSPERARDLLGGVLVLCGLLGALAAAAGALLIPAWLENYDPEIVRFAQWMMLIAPVPLYLVTYTAALQARERFDLYNAVMIAQPAFCLVSLGLLALLGAMTSWTAAGATLVAGVPVGAWMTSRIWKLYEPRFSELGWSVRRLLSYGLRSYGTDILGALTDQVDRVLVVGLLNPGRMGLYVVALNLAQVLNVVSTSIVTILFPRASGRPLEEVLALTGRAVRVSLALSVVSALAAGLLGPELIELVYGREFLEAVGVFRLLLLEAILRGTVWVLAQAFMACGRPGLVSVVQGVGLGLAAPLVLLLVPRLGLEGAAVALLIATSVRLVSVLACFPAAFGRRPPKLMFTADDLRDLRGRWGSRPR